MSHGIGLQMENKRKITSLILAMAIILLQGASAYAMSPEQRKLFDSGVQYFNLNDDDCVANTSDTNSATGGLKSGDSIYILGDSITVGASQLYNTKFTEKGITPKINAFIGRSWTTSGGFANSTTGQEAVESGSEDLVSAKAVVIALGSNGGSGANPITNMIDTVRSKNPSAPIWWVNTAGTAKYSTDLSYLGPFNKGLSDNYSAKNFRIIDWLKTVNPGGDPTISPTLDPNNLLADGLHPNANGYEKLASLVVSSTTSGASSDISYGSGCTCSTSSTDASLLGNDNAEKAFRYLLGKGLTPEQSAGAVGNFMQESGIDPEIIQGGKRSQNPNDAGSKGWGLMQWTPGSKITDIARNANITTPIHELGTQLEIVWWHMNNTSPTGVKNFIEKYKQTTTVAEATSDFENRMEAAGKPNMPRRIKFAQEALASYGGLTGSSSIGNSNANCVTTGGTGQLYGNFTVYSQSDPAWKDLPYGSSTIGESGCGPSAMAMIITTITGKKVTPVETANYAASQGMYIDGIGSGWNIGPVVAKNWGLQSEPVARDVGAITNAINSGKLVIAPGQGAKPFTSGGHFIVIRGVTSNGNWLVGDSGHKDTSAKEWPPEQLVTSMRNGGIYAVFK